MNGDDGGRVQNLTDKLQLLDVDGELADISQGQIIAHEVLRCAPITRTTQQTQRIVTCYLHIIYADT